jgi:hypothetical protein
MPVKTAARMTAFRPGQSPPLVRMPMLMAQSCRVSRDVSAASDVPG